MGLWWFNQRKWWLNEIWWGLIGISWNLNGDTFGMKWKRHRSKVFICSWVVLHQWPFRCWKYKFRRGLPSLRNEIWFYPVVYTKKLDFGTPKLLQNEHPSLYSLLFFTRASPTGTRTAATSKLWRHPHMYKKWYAQGTTDLVSSIFSRPIQLYDSVRSWVMAAAMPCARTPLIVWMLGWLWHIPMWRLSQKWGIPQDIAMLICSTERRMMVKTLREFSPNDVDRRFWVFSDWSRMLFLHPSVSGKDIGPEENGLHVERQPIWLVEKELWRENVVNLGQLLVALMDYLWLFWWESMDTY